MASGITTYSQEGDWSLFNAERYFTEIKIDGDYLWAGTNFGLLRYNMATGDRKVFLSTNSGFKGEGVEAIEIAPDGSCWVGSKNAGLLHYRDGVWKNYFKLDSGEFLTWISKLKFAPDGTLWFVSNADSNCSGCQHLFSFKGGSFTNHDSNLGSDLGSLTSQDLEIDDEGNLWFVDGGRVLRYTGNTAVTEFTKSDLGLGLSESLIKIKLGESGTIWLVVKNTSNETKILKIHNGEVTQQSDYIAGTVSWLASKENDGLQVFYAPSTLSEPIYATVDSVINYHLIQELPDLPPQLILPRVVEVGENGEMVLLPHSSSGYSDIYKLQNGSIVEYESTVFDKNDLLALVMAQDCRGNYWISGKKSFFVFDGHEWDRYDLDSFGINGSVSSFVADENSCDVYVILENYSSDVRILKYDGSAFVPISVPGSGVGFYDLAIDSYGGIWVAKYLDGLAHYDGVNWEIFDETNSPISNYVTSVEIDQDGNIWLVDNGKGVYKFDGVSGWEFVGPSSNPFAYWLFIDDQGAVWTSFFGGVIKMIGDEVIKLNIPGLIYPVQGMQQDESGNYWFATLFRGALKYDGSSIVEFNIRNSQIPSNFVANVFVDNFQNKWFLHGRSLSVYNERGLILPSLFAKQEIVGHVFIDENQNGEYDLNADVGVQSEKVVLLPDSLIALTNSDGEFRFKVPPGDYHLMLDSSFSSFEPVNPAGSSVTLPPDTTVEQNLAVYASGEQELCDMELVNGMINCGNASNFWILIKNNSSSYLDGVLNVTVDDRIHILGSTPPADILNEHSLQIHFDSLKPFSTLAVSAELFFSAAMPDSSKFYIEAQLKLFENGLPFTEIDRTTWVDMECSMVDEIKQVSSSIDSAGTVVSDGDFLYYKIFFRNTQNDTVFNLVVKDTLDSNLNFESFKFEASSHECDIVVSDQGVIQFVFEDINLPPMVKDPAGSQGYVAFSILPAEGIPDSSLILNRAQLFYGMDPVIFTNYTNTRLILDEVSVTVGKYPDHSNILIFPNPSTGTIFIDVNQSLQGANVAVFDLNGKIVQKGKLTNGSGYIEGLQPGFYFVRVFNDKHGAVAKVLVIW
ncbi:MAG: hypothetical protein Kow0027_20270 [Saprospiraceae bacterium]